MADAKDLVTKRKEAYNFIKNTLRQPPWRLPLDASDAQLADILGGTIELTDSLRLLRKGKHNPTNRLLTAFKNFVSGIVAESEIDTYLVDPFKDS